MYLIFEARLETEKSEQGFARILINLAGIDRRREGYELSESRLARAELLTMKKYPFECTASTLGLAMTWIRMGKNQSAESYLEALLADAQLNSDKELAARVLCERALMANKAGLLSEVRGLLSEARSLNPSSRTSLLITSYEADFFESRNLGADAVGRRREARAGFEALGLLPESLSESVLLVRALRQVGRQEEACTEARKLRARASGALEYFGGLADEFILRCCRK